MNALRPRALGDRLSLLRVRDASARDVPLILSLVRELVEYEREPDSVIATEADLRRDGFRNKPKFRVVIAEVDRNPAGMALFFQHYSTWQGRAGIFVEDLFVRPEYRKHGVGKALMARLASIALAEDCYGMRWEVHSWNRKATWFYRKLGASFRQHGRVMQLKHEQLKILARG